MQLNPATEVIKAIYKWSESMKKPAKPVGKNPAKERTRNY